MERRWVVLFSGLIILTTLATFGLGYFYVGLSVTALFFGLLFALLGLGLMTLIYSGVIAIIDKSIWRHGVFLNDDRQQSVAVDDSLMKSEFKITKEQRKDLAPKFKKMDPWTAFHNLLVIGMLVVGVGIVLITSYSSISIPGFVSGIYMVLWVVVGVYVARHMKLLFLKMNCLAALLNRRCGCCLYELQGQIPESDGCVVCPECGGAWRLDRCQKCATKLDSVDTDSCQECGWNRPATHEAESEPAR